MVIMTARCLSSGINSVNTVLILLPSLNVGIGPRNQLDAISNSKRHAFMASDIIQADIEPRRPNTMRARARQATEILKTQLLGTGAIEPLVALYFDDHIEQVEFQDPSVLEHFDVRTARSFDYLRTLVRIKNPQAALITLGCSHGTVRVRRAGRPGRHHSNFPDARFSSSNDSGSSALHTLWREDRRVKCSLHGDARDEGGKPCPLFSRFSRMYLWLCAERAHRLLLR